MKGLKVGGGVSDLSGRGQGGLPEGGDEGAES